MKDQSFFILRPNNSLSTCQFKRDLVTRERIWLEAPFHLQLKLIFNNNKTIYLSWKLIYPFLTKTLENLQASYDHFILNKIK